VPQQFTPRRREARHAGTDHHRGERQAVLERRETHRGVGEDVLRAQLQEAAVRAETLKTGLDVRARERVEHHVDASAARLRQDLVLEVQRARVHHVFDAD
jgi:hypothetical protein